MADTPEELQSKLQDELTQKRLPLPDAPKPLSHTQEARQAQSAVQDVSQKYKFRVSRYFTIEMLMATFACLAALALMWSLLSPTVNIPITLVAGITFTLAIITIIRLLMDPDSIKAQQSDTMLRLASQTLDCMRNGLTMTAAQNICSLLLPNTAAIAIAITDRTTILGYQGFNSDQNSPGSAIKTQATRETIEDGHMRILYTAHDIGFPHDQRGIHTAIIMPLLVGRKVAGVLKFYYRRGNFITETQKSIAEGLGNLLSTQMTALEMEHQQQLATDMELKMLQSQINPHFLFNTINTIAALIRTDPDEARLLLREFAIFYRRTLEDSSDHITLTRELEQTKRYFSFELARFGSDRLDLRVDVPAELDELMVPPFLLQPLVENAVHHGMPSEGKLIVEVRATRHNDVAVLSVSDNGVGMSAKTRNTILHPESSTGVGIAVKNVYERLRGCYGPDAAMDVQSELGKGTVVTLSFPNKMKKEVIAE